MGRRGAGSFFHWSDISLLVGLGIARKHHKVTL